MKVRPIRRLKWEFNKLLESPKLDAFEIYDALERHGIISAVALDEDGMPTHYRELLKKPLSKIELNAKVLGAIVAYCRREGIDYATRKNPATPIERPEDHYDPKDFGV